MIVNYFKQLHNDNEPLFQEDGAYTYLLNGLLDDAGTILNEPGTTIQTALIGDIKILGHCIINNAIVLFYLNNNFSSVAVVYLDPTGNNTLVKVLISNTNNAKLKLTEDVLNFKETNLIQGVGRVNYKNERIVYFVDGLNDNRFLNVDEFNTKSLSELNVSQSNLNFKLKLTLEQKISVVNYVAVETGGQLLSGVYQFAARYRDNNGNVTSFGIVSNPISIVDDSENSLFFEYDGCPPQTQTNKSITIRVENLDENYPFVEIATITYVGAANTPVYTLIARVNNTKTSILYQYLGYEKIGDLTLDELSIDGTFYKTAKHITQKDNMLFLHNLTTESEDLGFQNVANNIELFFTLNEINISQTKVFDKSNQLRPEKGLGDIYSPTILNSTENKQGSYKDPIFSASNATYMENEVYSFGLVVFFKNGASSSVYPISPKANGLTEESQIVIDTVFDKGPLLTYESLETYGKGFGELENQKVKHFKFPLRRNVRTRVGPNLRNIPIRFQYGVVADNIVFTQEQKDRIQGYAIVRQRRNVLRNKSVISQGFSKYLNASRETNSGYRSMFGLGDWLYINFDGSIDYYNLKNSANIFKANVSDFPAQTPPLTNDDLTRLMHGSIERDICEFLSPDHIHNSEDLRFANKVKYVGDFVYYKSHNLRNGNAIFTYQLNSSATTSINNPEFLWSFRANFLKTQQLSTNIVESLSYPMVTEEKLADDNSFFSSNFDKSFVVYGNNKTPFLIKTDNPVKITLPYLPNVLERNGAVNDYTPHYLTRTLSNAERNSLFNDSDDFQTSAFEFIQGNLNNDTKDLYTQQLAIQQLEITNSRQYGKIEEGEYVYCQHSFNLESTSLSFMNGDTFLTMYWMHIIESMVRPNEYNTKCQTLVELPIYSQQNYNLRHFNFDNASTEDTFEGTVPYFPKLRRFWNYTSEGGIGIFNLDGDKQATSYNKQYGFRNVTKRFFPKPLNFEEITQFPNRTIASDILIEGEQYDAYRVFKVNNYQDCPLHRGEITDAFVLNNALYIHTAQSLFRTYVNEKSAISSSSGEIVLGNAGMFSQPMSEIYGIDGGYAGTNTKWANITTPIGRIFIDDNQKNIWLFTGEGFEDLSDKGQRKWSDLNIVKKQNSYADRFIAAYDFRNQRYIMLDVASGKGISFFTKFKTWMSYHDWKNNKEIKTLFSFADTLYSIKGGTIASHNNDINKGLIYNEQIGFEVEVVVNKEPLANKVFDSVVVNCDFYDLSENSSNSLLTNLEFFDKLHIENQIGFSQKEFKITNTIPLDTNFVYVKRKGNEYRFHIPRFEAPNYVKQRVNGKFCKFKFKWNNSNNKTLKLQLITTNVRLISR